MVTMPPCHGVRYGFESRWSRKRKAVKQLQAVLALDLADEDTKNKQTELTLKALRELGSLTKAMQ